MQINSGIFKAYDIRGLYPGEINETVAREIGRGYAAYLNVSEVGVSRDMRVSSPAIAAAFIDGVRMQGTTVVDLGMLPTDAMYFAVANGDLEGGAQITASHNPGQYNGIKMVRAEALPLSGDAGIGDIRDMIAADRVPPPATTPGRLTTRDIVDPYVEKVMSFIDPSVVKPFKVVLDAGSGMAGLVAPKMFARLPSQTTRLCFDIDGTLFEGSTERRFWPYLARRGYQGPRQILAYLWFLVRFLPVYGRHTPKKNKAYLSGLETHRVRALATSFVTTEVVPRLYAPTVQRLQRHLRHGDTVVLLSGTLEPIARALADALGVQHVRATVCSERDGRYLARPPEVHPFGAVKLDLAVQLAMEVGADLQQASAYGDSKHDLCLLEAVANPVAVLPDPPLLATARGNDWDIIAGRNSPSVLPQ